MRLFIMMIKRYNHKKSYFNKKRNKSKEKHIGELFQKKLLSFIDSDFAH